MAHTADSWVRLEDFIFGIYILNLGNNSEKLCLLNDRRGLLLSPSNAEATFVQSTRMQRFLKII